MRTIKSIKTYGGKPYFCGNEVSKYGQQNGYVDYGTLAHAFDAVLNNDIMSKTDGIGYWEQIHGFIDNEDEITEAEEKLEELQDHYDTWDELRMDAEERLDEETGADEMTPYAEWLVGFLGGLCAEYEKRMQTIEEEIEKTQDEINELQTEMDESIGADVFQWYIISDSGDDLLEYWTNEIIYYNEELDMYLWGVTHWGTSWDYVLTDIRIEKGEE